MKIFIKKHYAQMIYILLITLSFIFVIFSTSFKVGDTLIKNTCAHDFTEGWYIIDNGEPKELKELSRLAGNAVYEVFTICHSLPDNLESDAAIAIVTKNEIVQAYVDDVLIYEYLIDIKTPYKTEVGAIRNIISIPEGSSGKTIKLVLTPQYGSNGKAPYEVLIGDINSIYNSLIKESIVKIIFSVLLIVIAFIFFFIAISYIMNKNKHLALQSLYFGSFVFLATLWYATDGLIFQFIFNNKMISYLTFNITFMLMPLPFTLFMAELYPKYKKMFNIMTLICGIYFVIRMVLYICGIINFEFALIIIHILMAVIIVMVAIICINELKQGVYNDLLFCTGIFIINASISLIIFYAKDKLAYNRYNYSTFFFIGIFAFAIIYLISEIQKNREFRQMAIEAKYYETCAFTDNLTGKNNRAAYERDLDEFEENKIPMKYVSL